MNTPTPEDIRSRLLTAKLPSPPQTLLKLLSLCQSDDASLTDLATLIASDPALSAKVLAVAHSAAYHQADAQALTLLQATSRLGTALIKVLAISDMVAQTFNGFTHSSGLDLRGFWKHSLRVALLAKELAVRLDYPSAEEAYLAGLLHDIGRLALLAAAPQQAPALFTTADDAQLCAQERQSLGMAHTAAGAWLLGRWHLGDALVESVLRHHDASVNHAGVYPLTSLVHLAHRMAELPLDEPTTAAQLSNAQGLSPIELEAVAQHAAGQLEQVARDLGIDISTAVPLRSAAAGADLAPSPNLAQPLTALQSQLFQEVFDRSVLNEMAMTLIAQDSNDATLMQIRQHASALLQLEDAVVMLMRSNQQQLVPVSMNAQHLSAGRLLYDVSNDAVFANCIDSRKVVFAGRNSRCAVALLDILAVDEMVLIPLLSARNCLGVLAAAVPVELSPHLHRQTATLQAFGTYVGLALSRRRQATMSPETLSVISRQEQRVGLMKMVQTLRKQASPLGSADLCLALRLLLQKLKDSRLVPDTIKVRGQLADQPCLVRGSTEAVQLVTLVLICNAFERMPRGGSLNIEAGLPAYRHGARFTALTLSDTAPSSELVIQAELNEPRQAPGTSDASLASLGDVKRMVDAMSGHLSVKAGDAGTRFDILLPGTKQT